MYTINKGKDYCINQRTCGYTLIELLLVIALMSIIAAGALMTYRQHIENSRLTKAALQMQSVLQAAMSFNANTGMWPVANNQIPECTNTAPPSDAPFVKNYLPNQNALTNFGSYFCWGEPENDAHLFWVAMQAPLNDINLAKQIAAQLPNAITTTDPNNLTAAPCEEGSNCFIRAEIPENNVGAIATNGIAGAGDCPDDDGTVSGSAKNMSCTYEGLTHENQYVHYQVRFDCPATTEAHLLFTPTFIDTGLEGKETPTSLWKLEPSITCTHNDSTPNRTCSISVYAMRNNEVGILFSGSRSRGQLKFSYIAYCRDNIL